MKTKTVVGNIAGVFVALVGVQACMPETVEVGRGGDETTAGSGAVRNENQAGTGGRASTGGTGGTGRGNAGGAGALGGSAGQMPSAGKGGGRATAGHGGTDGANGGTGTGALGGAGVGGATGGAGGGVVNAGGDAGSSDIAFDPVCDCKFVEGSLTPDFDCTLSIDAFMQRVSVPTDCELDANYVRRQDCDDGTRQFSWLVGGENSYEVVLDGETASYAQVYGYVGAICGIDPSAAHVGTVTAGTLPAHACLDACSICGGGQLDGDSPPPACTDTPTPACDCHLLADDVNHTFSCTITAAAAATRLSPPTSCDGGIDYVRRRACSGATTAYHWMEGGENSFELVTVDSAGTFMVYASADGYVASVCEESYPGRGLIESGPVPDLSTCGAECTVCAASSAADQPPACEQCTLDASGLTATETVAEYCAHNTCPTLDQARARAATACTGGSSYARMYSDCGVVAVEYGSPVWATRYYFDATTHALVGAYLGNDRTGGPCNAFTYEIGQIPASDCADHVDCDLCAADGAGGASAGLAACSP